MDKSSRELGDLTADRNRLAAECERLAAEKEHETEALDHSMEQRRVVELERDRLRKVLGEKEQELERVARSCVQLDTAEPDFCSRDKLICPQHAQAPGRDSARSADGYGAHAHNERAASAHRGSGGGSREPPQSRRRGGTRARQRPSLAGGSCGVARVSSEASR